MRNMNSGNKILVVLFFSLIAIGCDNGTTDQNSGNSGLYGNSSDNIYYVKYEISGGGSSRIDAKLSTENGSITISNFTGQYSEIFGPFSKGFLSSIETEPNPSNSTTNAFITVRIYVCRYNEPFALKAFSISENVYKGNPFKINYEIDF